MARKRMLSMDIINTDQFLSLSLEARALYMHLNLAADDDGFISTPISTTNMVGANKSMLQELIDSGFIMSFPSGICLVTDWYRHNTLKGNVYTETIHLSERKQVYKDNKRYFLCCDGHPTDYVQKSETQSSKEKINKDKASKIKKSNIPNAFNNYPQRNYTAEEMASLEASLINEPVSNKETA